MVYRMKKYLALPPFVNNDVNAEGVIYGSCNTKNYVGHWDNRACNQYVCMVVKRSSA